MGKPSEGNDWVIEIDGASRVFGVHEALQPVYLNIGRSEIFGIVGPDGAGKTTLMQMLAAILDPSSGSCRVLGFDSVRQAAQVTSRIGYMSQGFTLYDRLSANENLAFAAQVRGVDPAAYRIRRGRLLEMAGLAESADRPAGQLSGGMRKKLALCATLIHEPELLLLDEPSLGVDPVSRRELWRMLNAYREQGTSIVLSTPYMDEAQRCDRLAFLEAGRLLAVDTPSALAARTRGTVFVLHTENGPAAHELLTASEDVVSVQWRAAQLRFQLRAQVPLAESLYRRLHRIGRVEEAEPDLENAFVSLLQGHRAYAPQATRNVPFAVSLPEAAIRAEAVTVRFGSFTALVGVSIGISAGEVVGLLGPNGAGKTTLMRVLSGLLRPLSGAVWVGGVDVRRSPRASKARTGYMSQRFSLYPDLTVGENLDFFAGVYGLDRGARLDVIKQTSRALGLAGSERRRAGQLSGALRQRLALACAILHRPQALYLDEPTAGVDPIARQRFWGLIHSLAASGMAVLVTTHYLEEARYCHRVALMAQGRLLGFDTIAGLHADLGSYAPVSRDDVEGIFMGYLERDRGRAAAQSSA